MGKRLKFLSGEQREFLLEVEKRSGLSGKDLAGQVGIVGRSYRDWRREKLNMSVTAARIFCERYGVELPEKEETLRSRADEYMSRMGKIGGYRCLALYGSPGTLEGRRRGGRRAMDLCRALGKVPRAKEFTTPRGYSAALAEFVGAFLGDGGLTDAMVAITLNGEADKGYVLYLSDLMESLFGDKPRLFDDPRSKAVRIYYNGVKLVQYLTGIGLRVGNKVRMQVGVPEWIREHREYRLACLRGLMETDGGVFWHRYWANGKRYFYRKMCFCNQSQPLLGFVRDVFLELGFHPKLVAHKRVWLYNQHEVERYVEIVGIHNPRLIKKVGG